MVKRFQIKWYFGNFTHQPFDLMLNVDKRVDIVNFWKIVILSLYFLMFKSMNAKIMKD